MSRLMLKAVILVLLQGPLQTLWSPEACADVVTQELADRATTGPTPPGRGDAFLNFQRKLKGARAAAQRNELAELEKILRWTGPVPDGAMAEWNGFHRLLIKGTPKQLKLGLAVPLSGPHRALGNAIKKGVSRALRRSSTPIHIQDTKGTDEGARQAIRALAENQVTVVIGPIGHRESEAAAIEAARYKLALVSLTSKRSLERIHTNIFRYRCDRQQKADRLAVHAARGLRQRRAAILYPNGRQSREPMAAFWTKFETLGGQITGVESYDAGDSRSLSKAISALVGRRYTKYRARSKAWAKLNAKSRHAGHKVSPVVDFDVLFIAAPAEDLKLIVPFLTYWDIPVRGGQRTGRQENQAVQLLALDFRPSVGVRAQPGNGHAQIHLAECVSGSGGLDATFPILAQQAFELASKLTQAFRAPSANPERHLSKSPLFRWSAYGLHLMQPSLYFVNQYGRLEELGH